MTEDSRPVQTEDSRPVQYDPIAHQVRILGYAMAVLVALVVIGMGAGFWFTVSIVRTNKANIARITTNQQHIRELTEDGMQAKRAICAYKDAVQDSVSMSEKYFDDIRTGRRAPIPGISVSDLQASLTSERDTLRALGTLQCPDPPAPK